ncbi:MAG TPA: hypothetical protein ACHBX0_07165 [Arsenophonus sp.]
MANGSQENVTLVSLIREQLKYINVQSRLLSNEQVLASLFALLLERLSDINHTTDIDRTLWPRFQ